MLNWRPIRQDIYLGQGDCIIVRRNAAGALPPGTTAEIIWATPEPTTWDGTVEGDTVSWHEEQAAVADIPHGTPFTAWVRYPNAITEGEDDYEWIVGHAVRDY